MVITTTGVEIIVDQLMGDSCSANTVILTLWAQSKLDMGHNDLVFRLPGL